MPFWKKSPEKASSRPQTKSKKKDHVEEVPAMVDLGAGAGPMPGEEYTMPTREIVKPPNQLQLSEAELSEEIAKMLTANNPAAPKNVARFNMKERCYKFEPMVEHTITHYASDGWLLHRSSDEAVKQQNAEKHEEEASVKFQAEIDRAAREKEAGMETEAPDDSRQLRNQFNFNERAAQTFNYPMRDRETFTEPPPTASMSGACNTYEIYDEYVKDVERQRLEEASKAKPGAGGAGKKNAPPAAVAHRKEPNTDPLHSTEMVSSLLAVDRMVNQNMYEEIAMDFKYWDDNTDEYRPGEGTLLPLWKFQHDAAKKHVTSLAWNPKYDDLFAVGYGSFNFMKQSSGVICIFSLKNPTTPEYKFTTESGVMCLHFHPENGNLLAVGCYDGSVAVFDVRATSNAPLYLATVQSGKHSEPVWQVFWQADELQKDLQFVSISSDGRVTLWTLSKAELLQEVLMKLQHQPQEAVASAVNGHGATLSNRAENDTPQSRVTGGTCMDFSKEPGQQHIYLVGTEEGLIHMCSEAYSSDYLSSYAGHQMSVYAVKWNLVHTRMFLSAAADWTVKLWDSAQQERPVMNFDLGASVGDVAWAPYSSTVFAAVSDDGKVHVYDINENKLLPMCSQKISKSSKLTKVVFNPRHPILLVGDSRGVVYALKLSPNLRKSCKPDKGQKWEELEVAKLEAVMDTARKSYVQVPDDAL